MNGFMGLIYMAVNTANNKIYIGQTPEQIEKSASKNRGRKASDETKQKMREIGKSRDLSYLRTPEVAAKQSAAARGIKKSEEHRNNIKAAKSLTKRKFTLISPDNIIVNACGVNDFAKEYNIDPAGVSMLINSKLRTYKGWRLAE